MQTVTRIEKTKGITALYLDGRLWLRLPNLILTQNPLSEGDDIDPEAYLAKAAEDIYPRALEAAVTFLGPRARSEQEIRQRLARACIPEETVSRVLCELARLGLVNDRQFAQDWTQARAARAMGTRRIAQELRAKGVDPTAIDEALTEIDEDKAFADALTLAQKMLPRYANGPLQTAKRKLGQALARRGYNWDMINQILNNIMQEDEW